MIEKIKNNHYLKIIFDSHSLGLYILAIIALSVTWSSIKIIDKNYQLEKQISVLQQEVEVLDQQIKNQRLKNEYYRTNAYLELAARKYFGKSLPGEKLILVPTDVAEKYITKPDQTQAQQNSKKELPKFIQNWQDWLDFFLRRNQEN